MIRLATIFPPSAPLTARPATALPDPRPAPVVAAVQPAIPSGSAQSDTAFAVFVARTTGDAPDTAKPVQPLFADPLPDLPSIDAPASSTSSDRPGNAAR
jgi:hypothetical protein